MSKKSLLTDITLTFNKSDFVEEKLIDKVTLWMLRIILQLGGHREFINRRNDFSNEELVYFLDLGKYAYMDADQYARKEILEILQKKLHKLEARKNLSTNKVLKKNITQITALMYLNQYEAKILEFVVLIKQYDILNTATSLLGNELNTSQVKKALSVILQIPKSEVDKAFQSDSKLSRSSLVLIDKNNNHTLCYKLESISDTFLDNLLNLDEDITVMLKEALRPVEKSVLKLKDYKHIQNDLDILLPYLTRAVNTQKNGVNILLYGPPGTGKTELVKVLAKKLKTKLFEVSYIDDNDEPIDGQVRLKAYKSAQAFLTKKKTLLMYDEAEDVFESNDGFLSMLMGTAKRQRDKAWINKMLETNSVPMIWITNNVYSIDNALLRRFDMSIELQVPKKTTREKILKQYAGDLLDDATIKILAKNENIAPAIIDSATKVLSNIELKDNTQAFMQLINNVLKAQGHKVIEVMKGQREVLDTYNPNYINTTTDLKKLTQGIEATKNARICLYGVPGTGKSAFAKYIADKLEKTLLLKKGSDLISKYIGETEKNIADAFEEAKAEDAVLVFDEVDSFLADRTQAKQSWEVTQVNEMLVQMENFDGIFIATTNLMDNLDAASLRRFDLKLGFDYLKPEQAYKMFKTVAKKLNLSDIKSLKEEIKSMRYLTLGDFAAVVRQNRFRPIDNAVDFLQRLKDEVDLKNIENNGTVGFL